MGQLGTEPLAGHPILVRHRQPTRLRCPRMPGEKETLLVMIPHKLNRKIPQDIGRQLPRASSAAPQIQASGPPMTNHHPIIP